MLLLLQLSAIFFDDVAGLADLDFCLQKAYEHHHEARGLNTPEEIALKLYPPGN